MEYKIKIRNNTPKNRSSLNSSLCIGYRQSLATWLSTHITFMEKTQTLMHRIKSEMVLVPHLYFVIWLPKHQFC